MKVEKPIRVLVIDDSESSRRTITRILDSSPLVEVVGWAPDGQEALRKVIDLAPDLVTLDISMPEASGARFYKEMKQDPELASVPIVIVTAVTGFDGDPYAYKKFLGSLRAVPDPEGFHPKPIERDELLATIQNLLSGTGGSQT